MANKRKITGKEYKIWIEIEERTNYDNGEEDYTALDGRCLGGTEIYNSIEKAEKAQEHIANLI